MEKDVKRDIKILMTFTFENAQIVQIHSISRNSWELSDP